MFIPGAGDAIQMQKAGIIEIGDIYDVNKKDLGGEDLVVQIEIMLDNAPGSQSGWRPPVVMTNAVDGDGIENLIEKIFDHKEYLEQSELLEKKKKRRYAYKLKESMMERIEDIILKKLFDENELEGIAKSLLEDKFEIYSRLDSMFDKIHFKLTKED
jgi:LAO/AO transport system kinase